MNTEPDFRQDPTVPAFGKFAQAEGDLEYQMVCQMYGKPVPKPSSSTAATSTPTTPRASLSWPEFPGQGLPSSLRN